MSEFGTKEEIIKSIENHFLQMESRKLSMQDLEELVSQARELYERTLILRYKAYEVKVFGELREVLEVEIPAEKVVEVISEEEEIEEETQEEISADIEITKEEEKVSDEPIFDFDVFDEKIEEKEEVISESIPEIKEEKVEAQEIVEDLIDTKLEPTRSFLTQTESSDIFNKILESDNSLGSLLMSSKLNTLIGSFGFNEKYQCIQELFNGSSEEFNQAIDLLDNLDNLDQAKNQLEFYVDSNSWDLESELVAEFVTKVARRYK
jgi:hypothetical protein